MADDLLSILHKFDNTFSLNYNKYYIGLSKNGVSNNFLAFRPQKKALLFDVRLPRSDELTAEIESSGIDLVSYSTKHGRYRFRLEAQDVNEQKELLERLVREAYEAL
ncbi:MAG: hypothetical protein ABFS24_02425 [Pseudomonadota bacterium]